MAFYLGDKKAANVIAYFDKGIIEVSELPTENIHEDRIYAVVEDGQYKGFYIRKNEEWVSFEIPDPNAEGKYIEAEHKVVDVPNATAIKKYAFYQDSILENIIMPNVTVVEQRAFEQCRKLALTELPAGLTFVGHSAFCDCTGVKISAMPNALETIEERGFRYCAASTFGALPSALKHIGANAFYGCTGMRISSIPSGVEDIGAQAFYGCRAIANLTFLGKPNSISESAFLNCANLTAIYVPWEEGEVANEPWGATNASIYYDA